MKIHSYRVSNATECMSGILIGKSEINLMWCEMKIQPEKLANTSNQTVKVDPIDSADAL